VRGPFEDVDLLSPEGAGDAQSGETPGDGESVDVAAAESGAPPLEVEVNFAETGELPVPVDLSQDGASSHEETGATSESESSLDAEAPVELDFSAPAESEAAPFAEIGSEATPGVPSSDDLSASFGSEAESTAAESGPPVEELSFEGADAPVAGESETLAPAAGEDTAHTPPAPPSSKQILEDLEEADFYYQQGLLEDAENVYRRVLEAAPTNPQALLRLGEIAASRGEDPGEGTQSEEAAPSEDFQPSDAGMQAAEVDDALGDDLANWEEPSEAVADETVAPSLEAEAEAGLAEPETAAEGEPEGEPAGFDTEGGSTPVELEGEPESEAASFEAESVAESIDEEAADREDRDADEGESPIAHRGDGAPSGAAEISHFDLAAELSDELRMEDTVAALPEAPAEADAQPAASASAGEDSLEAIFSEFKRGVRKTLTAADHETHYDLGIAYREMGLLEDAVGEFRVAMELPQRRLDSLHLMGLCARDLKRYQDAINCFCQALADGEPSDERRAAIDFDLAITLEESGDAEGALRVFESVHALAPEFPGLAERMEALKAMDALSPAEPEAATDAEEPPSEVFESFDDLIADATAADVTEESEPAVAEASGVQTVEEEPHEAPETSSASEEVSAEAEDGVDDAVAEAEGAIDDGSVEAADGAEETVAEAAEETHEVSAEAAEEAEETVAEAADGADEPVAEAADGADEPVAEAADGAEAAVAEASETLDTAEPATTVEASEASEAPAADEEPEAPEPPDAPPSKPKRGKSSRRRKISFG
jgi:tetratricopeptide (TPR) repeat protein